jgi:hypothetical protein
MFSVSITIMFVSLTLQGLYLFARDAVTQHLSNGFVASDYTWLLALISLAFFKRFPIVTVICAWIAFLTFATLLGSLSQTPNALRFLEGNGLLITNLLFAHLGMYLKGSPKMDTNSVR